MKYYSQPEDEMTLEHTKVLYHILAPLEGVHPAQLRRVASALVGRGGEYKACGRCLERAIEHLHPDVPPPQEKPRGFEESYGSSTFPLGSGR